MCETRVQELTAQLQEALGIRIVCGSIILNVNESRLSSVKTETYQRIEKSVDKRKEVRQSLTT